MDVAILNKLLNNCKNEQQVIETKNIFIKQYLSPLYEQLKNANDKKTLGLQINEYKKQIETVTNQYLNRLKNQSDIFVPEIDQAINVNILKLGKKHIINSTIDLLINFFKKYDFEFVNGEEITTTKFNFDNLNIGEDHVARNTHDTLFINPEVLLRTHCTASTAKVLCQQSTKNDIRVLSYGNVYRKDEDDATHSHQFTQIDIVWLRPNFSLANLKYIVNQLINYLFSDGLDVRYRLSYFPFTEPSFEVDVQCINCLGEGCHICKDTGWIEIMGAGMLNQAVIEATGIKNINTGMAFGIGIERIAMLKYNVKDIRDFYNNDFDFNKQFNA